MVRLVLPPVSICAGKKWPPALHQRYYPALNLRPAINLVDGERELLAGFAEFSLPLYQDLTASVAGRADRYDDFGSAFSPKLGLHYVLNEDWLLRNLLVTWLPRPLAAGNCQTAIRSVTAAPLTRKIHRNQAHAAVIPVCAPVTLSCNRNGRTILMPV